MKYFLCAQSLKRLLIDTQAEKIEYSTRESDLVLLHPHLCLHYLTDFTAVICFFSYLWLPLFYSRFVIHFRFEKWSSSSLWIALIF